MNIKRLAGAALAAALVLVMMPQSVVAAEKASEKTEVTAAVHKFFDNLGDEHLQTALAVCDSPVSIIDEFPPHEWNGPQACADWWKDFKAYNQKNGITEPNAALGAAWSVDVSGDRAYFVSPATYTYKQHGKSFAESHAVFTAALKRTQAGWRITGWTWAKH